MTRAPISYEHLDDLAASGVSLRLPESRHIPLHLCNALLPAADFKTLHEESATALREARRFLSGRNALLAAAPQWEPHLKASLWLHHETVVRIHAQFLAALERAEEVWPEDDTPPR